MKLLPFDFTIVYQAGRNNQGVDELSRRPQHADFLVFAIPINMDFMDPPNELLKDLDTSNIIESLQLISDLI